MMKRVISLLLTLIMCLSLCACGKSEAATAYEALVEEIGTVSLDSEESIIEAENAYQALTDKEKKSVEESNDILENKRAEYDSLELEARLDSVIDLIDAIGNVTVDSEAAILAAEEAYDNLSDEEKSMITDAANTLTAARSAYDSAVAEQMAMNAAEVTSAIEAIGTVTLDSKDAINNARELYNALTSEEKQLVTTLDILETAEATYESLRDAENQRIITEYSAKFETESDPIEGITWYMHNSMPDYIDIRSYIIPYIGVQGNRAWICIRYNYTADSWIFWENLTIMVDGTKYNKYVGPFDTIRDNDTEIWEFWDEALDYNQPMSSTELQMLNDIANSTETIIRFEGDDYYDDLYVTDTDRQIIRDTLMLYEALLG